MSDPSEWKMPLGYDEKAEEEETNRSFDLWLEVMPDWREVYRAGEAAGFKRGFEAARAQLLRAVAEAPISQEPPPLLIEGPKPKAAEAPPPPPPLPLWSPERDEVLTDGWQTIAPLSRTLQEINRLPGPTVQAADVGQRSAHLRLQPMPAEFFPPQTGVWSEVAARGLNWTDSLMLAYDAINKLKEAAKVLKKHGYDPAAPRPRGRPPKAAPSLPAAAPPPSPAPPPEPPAAAPAPPPAPEPPPPPPLTLWSPARDEVLRDGWTCWVPDGVILGQLNRLPGLPVTAESLPARASFLGVVRDLEHRERCCALWRTTPPLEWMDFIGKAYDLIAEEEQRKRDVKKAARAIAAAASAPVEPPKPKPALSEERRFLLESEWPGFEPTASILERYNGLPGAKTDRLGLIEVAERLGLKRPEKV